MVINGSALNLPVRPNCINLIITSPPYFDQRTYTTNQQIGSGQSVKEYLEDLWRATEEMIPTLTIDGSIWINLGDKYHKGSLLMLPQKYAIGCMDLGLKVKEEIIWNKINGVPESVTNRVQRRHEYWYHLIKDNNSFSNIDLIREPYKKKTEGLGRIPGSVWDKTARPLRLPRDIKNKLQIEGHFASFALEWPLTLIEGWCPKAVCLACGYGRRLTVATEGSTSRALLKTNGDCAYAVAYSSPQGLNYGGWHGQNVRLKYFTGGEQCRCAIGGAATTVGRVMDVFAGTGTVGVAAEQLERQFVLLDISDKYCQLAQWRLGNLPKQDTMS